MSKEKQIEGLAEAVRIGKHAMCDVCSPNGRDCEECETDRLVNAIYNAGYRKQSEVEYWKQQYFHSCVRNGCVDEKVIEYLLTNAEGHNDTVGEDGVEGEDGQGNLNPLYRMQKADVAREIFEEIEKCMEHDYISSIDVFSVALGLRIAELKKKYTEEKT